MIERLERTRLADARAARGHAGFFAPCALCGDTWASPDRAELETFAREHVAAHGFAPGDPLVADGGEAPPPLVPDGPRRVIIESPYAGPDVVAMARNVAYARAALADSLGRGEAPMASHLLYTRALDDDDPARRAAGIAAGLAWGEVAAATVVYADLGISPGMAQGIEAARLAGRLIEERRLPAWAGRTM